MAEVPSYEALRATLIDISQNRALDCLNSAESTVPVEGTSVAYAATAIGHALIAINGNLERIADTLDEISARQEDDES